MLSNYFLQTLQKRFWESLQTAVEPEQPGEDPTTGIDTAPSQKEKPQLLQTHDQHTADYIRLMMQERMKLPMGEDRITIGLPFLSVSAFHH